MALLHFLLADSSVGSAPEKHHPVGDPPEEGFHFVVPVRGEHRLGARLRRTGDVVRQRGGHLDLEPRDVADREAEHAPRHHHEPERDAVEAGVREDGRQLAGQQHERKEEEARVQVVVIAEQPNALIDVG